MSKKLLSESQVRRFQSLASIQPLQEMGYKYEEEPVEEGSYAEGEHAEGKYMEEEAEAMHKEEPMEETIEEAEEDMDADMDEDGDADVELDEELVQRFMEAAEAIQEMAAALGGAADEMPAPMDMDDQPEMDMAPAEEPEEEKEDILETALEGVNYEPSKEEVVNEVAKRVAARIMEAKEAQEKLDKAL